MKAKGAVTASGTQLGQPFEWDGRLRSRIPETVPSIWSGKGLPTQTNAPSPTVGSLYFRVDGGGAGATHVYYCTVGGNPATWIGIA